MDHRMTMRVDVELPVEVRTRDRLLRGLAVDLSFDGVRVSLDNQPPLPAGMVWLLFEPDTVGIATQAMVVHQNRGEVGLMFAHYDGDFETYLTSRLTEALNS
jgi:hypothetical protein